MRDSRSESSACALDERGLMGHKAYIAFKTEDMAYKDAIGELQNIDFIDKSLTEPINSTDQEYIMQKIRSDYLYDSTVTIFLIGEYSAENLGEYEQYYIKKELQASLYSSSMHSKSGILGIVLPQMKSSIWQGSTTCWKCGKQHSIVKINDSTVVSEFSYNYYIPEEGKCAWGEDDRYCVLVTWDDFVADPNGWIDQAFDKRLEPIASKTKVRP